MNFTKEQEEAIFTRGEDILVSAGAGAGKTRVLVTRISELIMDQENPISADQMLVLTFTNAAAKEMKERIKRELEDRLENDPDNRSLRKQIRVVKHADISTVHSFCNHLLRTHFNELGIDPSFRILETGEGVILKEEAMEALLEDAYGEANDSFLNFVEAYCPGKNDLTLGQMIEDLYTFSRGFADTEGWYKRIISEFSNMRTEEGMENSLPIRITLKKAQKEIQKVRMLVERAKAFFDDTAEPEKYYSLILNLESMVETLESANSFQDLYDSLNGLSFGRLPTPGKKDKEWPHLEEVKEIYSLCRTKLKDLSEEGFLNSLSQVRIDHNRMYPLFEEYIRLGRRFAEIYELKKKEKNLLDFDDLEHYALKLLVEAYDEEGNAIPSLTAREIASGYKAIFVDEYQDTNLVQETIIEVLLESGQANLFVVGDVKQSIYRFRQARPDLFINRYHRYEQGQGRKIELRDNFRSSPDVLDFCNRFFFRFMKEDFGGIDYNENVSLLAGENGPMKEVRESQEALILIQDEEQESVDEDITKVLAEAAMIGDRIESLCQEGYQYSDMVILLRSGVNYSDVITEYLEERQIPAVCENQTGYFKSREIRVMLNYLSVIDNVYQDIPMASALLSGIGGLEAKDLAELKILVEASDRKKYSLYELMKSYLERGQKADLKEKIQRFLSLLEEFRQKKQEMLLHELVWDIYQKTGFYENVLSMPKGIKRRENLMMLMKKAQEYEKTMYKGLFYFIRYMDQLQTYDIELGAGSVADNVENLVKVMTIHKSKGLEFPVVFVSALNKQFNKRDLSKKVLFHPELGIGMDSIDVKERITSPSILKNVIKDQLNKETLEEELRILYVAMTRAQKKLILTGVIDQKRYDKLTTETADQMAAEDAKSFMDWVLPVLSQDEDGQTLRLFHYHEIQEIFDREKAEKEEITLDQLLEDEKVKQAKASLVEKAFSREYPYDYTVGWKRKYSVSELKKMAQTPYEGDQDPHYDTEEQEKEIPIPAFIEEKEDDLAGATYGTMVHKIMELLPFSRIDDKKSLLDELEKLYSLYPDITEFQKKKIYKGVEGFLFHEYGEKVRQMDREGHLYKEYPFTMGLDHATIDKDTAGGEISLVQGIIDLFGDDGDGLWLLDYKTDRVAQGQETKLLDLYKQQMLYYKLALEQMLGKKVKNTLIYSFALQEFVPVFWD